MSTTKLTGELILRQVYDPASESLKMSQAVATEMAIELNAADGDNVLTKPDNALIVAVDTPTSCVGMRSAQLYIEAGAAAGAKMQVSPVDSGDVWMDVTSGSIVNDTVDLKATTVATICARRIRATAVTGTPVIKLVIQAV